MNDSTIDIRPRTTWESIDLGILLARCHLMLLVSTWLLTTLPIFALLTFFFWDAPLIPFFSLNIPLLPIIICWWLKPIFERIPLYILSNAVFGHIPSFKETLLYWLKSLFSIHIIYDLIFNRFNKERGFYIIIKQLEKLKGKKAKQRFNNLRLTRPYLLRLMFIFVNFETALYVLAISLVFMLVPDNLYIEQTPFFDRAFSEQLPVWIIHLNASLYILIISFTEPLFVACNFCLYLNARTLLDGWDLELAFRRLSSRLSKTLPSLLIIICLAFTTSYSEISKANTHNLELPNKVTPSSSQPQPTAIDKERKASQQAIKEIVNAPPFHQEVNQTKYRWISNETNAKAYNLPSSKLPLYTFDGLGNFLHLFFNLLVWGTSIALLLYISWQIIKRIPRHAGSLKKVANPPKQLFGLTITPDSLPENIMAEFEALWQQDKIRQALSLLYRALLSHLAHQYKLPLKSSHTEGDIVKLTALLKQPQVSTYTQQLTQQWLRLAYGHQTLDPAKKEQLIQAWQQLPHTAQGTKA